jgi:hypothetical protein
MGGGTGGGLGGWGSGLFAGGGPFTCPAWNPKCLEISGDDLVMALTRPGAVNAVLLAVCSSSGEAELDASEPTMDAEVVVGLVVGGVRRGLEGIAGGCSVEGGCEWDVGRGVFEPCGGPQ